MLALNNLYINASAAKRILNLPQCRKIEFRYVGSEVVVIWEKTVGETTVDRQQFEQHFVDFRRQGAKECIAAPHRKEADSEVYAVTGSSGDAYYVEASSEAIACTCEDWLVHESICKHGYAVLNLLGLNSFDQYIQARQKVVALPEYRRPAMKVRGISIE